MPDPLDTLEHEIRQTLETELAGLVDAAASDLRHYAGSIASSAISIAGVPDAGERARLFAELRGQLKLIAEISRIRASNAAWDSVERIAATALRVGIAAAVAAV